MNAHKTDPRTTTLAASALLLVVLIAIQLIFPFDVDEFRTVESIAETPPLPESAAIAYEHPDWNDYSAVLAKSLFFPDREMPPGSDTVEAAPSAPFRMSLEGIAIVSNAQVAVLKDLDSNRLVQLSTGEVHNGWTLDAINPDRAAFSRGSERVSIVMNEPKR